MSTSAVEKIEFAKQQAARVRDVTEVPLTSGAELQQALQTGAAGQGEADAGAEVYEWHVTKLSPEQVVPAARVRDVATAFFMDMMRSRQASDRANYTDAQHRDAVLASSAQYSDMARTHPRMMLMLAAGDVTERKIKHLLDLLELRERQENSSLSLEQKQAQVSRYFMSNFVRAARPGEEEEAIQNGTGMRAEMVTMPRRA